MMTATHIDAARTTNLPPLDQADVLRLWCEDAGDLGQAYISRNLLRNLMLWLGKRNFPKYTVPGGWVEEIFQNISYMGVAPPPIFPK